MSIRAWPVALTIGFGVSSALVAQTPVPSEANTDSCSVVGISPEFFGRLIDRQFVGLVGSAQSVPGTFGSVEIDKDQRLALATSTQPGNGRVLTVSASGGVDDGIVAFINDRQSSSTFSAGLRYDFLDGPPPKGRTEWGGFVLPNKIQYDLASCRAYLVAWRKGMADGADRIAKIRAGASALTKRLDVLREGRHLDSVTVALAAQPGVIKARSDSLEASTTTDVMRRDLRMRLRMDSLKLDSLRFDSVTTTSRKIQAEQRFVPSPPVEQSESDDKRATDLQAAEQLLKVLGFAVSWTSIGIGLDNTSFKLFDPTAAFENQLTSKHYASPKIAFSFNRFSFDASAENTYYWSAGVHASMTDNLSKLNKVDLTEVKQYGPTPDDRSSKKDITARQGTYQTGLGAAGATVDIYKFITGANDAAWHLFPAVEGRQHSRPVYSAGIGFLWVVRKKDASFANAELFYSLNDIAEADPSPDNVWERSQLGLRVSFPINFSLR